MTNKQYIERQIELTNQLNAAANLEPYDPDLYNSTIEEINTLQYRFDLGLKVKKICFSILWLLMILIVVLIVYLVIM
ncbi:hypothetical protein ES702_05097 [subsurface metagenome]